MVYRRSAQNRPDASPPYLRADHSSISRLPIGKCHQLGRHLYGGPSGRRFHVRRRHRHYADDGYQNYYGLSDFRCLYPRRPSRRRSQSRSRQFHRQTSPHLGRANQRGVWPRRHGYLRPSSPFLQPHRLRRPSRRTLLTGILRGSRFPRPQLRDPQLPVRCRRYAHAAVFESADQRRQTAIQLCADLRSLGPARAGHSRCSHWYYHWPNNRLRSSGCGSCTVAVSH